MVDEPLKLPKEDWVVVMHTVSMSDIPWVSRKLRVTRKRILAWMLGERAYTYSNPNRFTNWTPYWSCADKRKGVVFVDIKNWKSKSSYSRPTEWERALKFTFSGLGKLQGAWVREHDRAYHHWKKLKLREATLLHIDAHTDLSYDNNALPIETSLGLFWENNVTPKGLDKRPNIGDYLHWALKDRLVKHVVWLMPDPWQEAGIEEQSIRIPTFGKDRNAIIDCVFSSGLPKLESPVLNIDLDYFGSGEDTPVGWQSPEWLAQIVRKKVSSIKHATVCESLKSAYADYAIKCYLPLIFKAFDIRASPPQPWKKFIPPDGYN